MAEVRWHPIDGMTYRSIYNAFDPDPDRHGSESQLAVFATHTCQDGQCQVHGETHIYTEWGPPDADYPIIRSLRSGDRWSYAIAIPIQDEEG